MQTALDAHLHLMLVRFTFAFSFMLMGGTSLSPSQSAYVASKLP